MQHGWQPSSQGRLTYGVQHWLTCLLISVSPETLCQPGSSENQTARRLWMCKTFVWGRNCERKVKETGGPADGCASLVSGEGEGKDAGKVRRRRQKKQ